MDIILCVFSLFFGALFSLMITHYYSKRSEEKSFTNQVMVDFQISMRSEGNQTHIQLPLYYLDQEYDFVLNVCPRCLGDNVYKEIIFQDTNGEREDYYVLGCTDCGYSDTQTDVVCCVGISKKMIRKIIKKRMKIARLNGIVEDVHNKRFSTGGRIIIKEISDGGLSRIKLGEFVCHNRKSLA
ncbi:MAG: hypothetical protein HGA67_04065 [Candidatus Yonathbacteria bacterium]|nr:hypothetical protein [Candidatus Yonathbacteria bacterium]